MINHVTPSSFDSEPNPVESLVEASSGKTTSQFTVQWTRPAGDLDGYRLWVGSSDAYTFIEPNNNVYTVNNREPGTQYTVRVAAVVGNMESDRRSLDVTTSR